MIVGLKSKMAIKCPNCGIKIFGEKKEGDNITCYKCKNKFIIKEGKWIKNG